MQFPPFDRYCKLLTAVRRNLKTYCFQLLSQYPSDPATKLKFDGEMSAATDVLYERVDWPGRVVWGGVRWANVLPSMPVAELLKLSY